jgi:hypothetical protein
MQHLDDTLANGWAQRDASSTEGTGPTAKTILLIGFATGTIPSGLCSGFAKVVIDKGPLSALILGQVLPDSVALPLITAQGDVVTGLQTLFALGYSGQCIVVAPKLPNPDMVLAELHREAPGLSISLLDKTP